MGKLRQFLTELAAHHMMIEGYYRFTFLLTNKSSIVVFITNNWKVWLSYFFFTINDKFRIR